MSIDVLLEIVGGKLLNSGFKRKIKEIKIDSRSVKK